jgi:hypothetical protein
MKRFISRPAAIAVLLSALALAGCGGGGSSADAPAPVAAADTGLATTAGTVTGFGSIIVDGVRIDNHAVLAGAEREDGSIAPVELKLGQHVEVQHDANLVATSVRVMSEVEGSVSAVTTATLTVMGQTVTVNNDPAAGPVTVFEAPYASLADVKVGDLVEVHGLLKTTTSGTATVSTIQATRIEPKDADAYNRVAGTVTNLTTTTFNLGTLLIDYSGAKLMPAGATLANGEEVRVSIPVTVTTSTPSTTSTTSTVTTSTPGTTSTTSTVTPSTPSTTSTTGTISTTTTTATVTPLKAAVVRVVTHREDSHSEASELGGAISSVSAGSKTFTVNGVTVDASAATFNQPGKSFADLKAGTYVVLRGVYDSTGVLKASTIVIRGIPADRQNPGVELHGTILNYTSVSDFTVRGIHVDASAATIDAASCGGTQLANNMQVEVEGSLTSTGAVKASSVKCEGVQDSVSIVEAEGRASTVDQTAKTFNLATEKGTVSVQWSSTTLFKNTSAATLDGQRLEVEGTLSKGVLQATKIMQAGR